MPSSVTSWIWKVSRIRPWPVSEFSDSSATRWANAARSRMICSTVSAADDRAQRAGQHLLGERLDVVLLAEEPLGGEPDLVGVAADLDDRDALDVQLDALAGDRAADLHRDAAAGQVEGGELLHERDRRTMPPPRMTFCPERSVVSSPGLGVEHRLALAAGDDERLVGTRHLVAAGHEQHQQDEEDDEADDRDQQRCVHEAVPFGRVVRTERFQTGATVTAVG